LPAARARGGRHRARAGALAAAGARRVVRRTKIIATLGPSCSSEETISRLLTSGVDVFRLNFSHGTADERRRLIEIIRRTATDFGKYIPIMGDIQGPKLRIGDVEGVVQLQ